MDGDGKGHVLQSKAWDWPALFAKARRIGCADALRLGLILWRKFRRGGGGVLCLVAQPTAQRTALPGVCYTHVWYSECGAVCQCISIWIGHRRHAIA